MPTMSRPVLPMLLVAGGVSTDKCRRLPVGRILILLPALLALGTEPAKSQTSAPPVTIQFETPPTMDPYTRAKMQEAAAENTERFRLRIALPQSAFASHKTTSTTTIAAAGDGASAAPENSLAADVTSFCLKMLAVFLGVLAWVGLARRFAPELLEHMKGMVPARVISASLPADKMISLLAEERAVLEFQAALSGKPAAGASAVTDEAADAGAGDEDVLASLATQIRKLRRLLQEAASTTGPAQRKCLAEGIDLVQAIKNSHGPERLLPLRQMATALEMLIRQLTEKASNVTASTVRTATVGVNLLEDLCGADIKPDLLSEPALRVLVADDEPLSRYALSHALKRGLGEPDVAETGEAALKLAAQRTYDLIVLDVQLPGMDGFELCSAIHETPANKTTPVVFVTALRDFEARANSVICGGRDLIAKPFLTFELTVKALTLVAGERMCGRGRLAATSVDGSDVVESAAPLPEVATESAAVIAETAPAVITEAPPAALNPALEPIRINPAALKPAPIWLEKFEPSAPFYAQARAQVEWVREYVELIYGMTDQNFREESISELFLAVHLIADSAEASGQQSISTVTLALEGLLKKFLENSGHVTTSSLQVMAAATALLQELCAAEAPTDLAVNPPIRALVVDDDFVALRAISNALQMRMSKPETATDGRSALALAREMSFDVIFLDVQMPDMTGFEVCEKIRESSANRSTPVVFVTNHETSALRAKVEACGGTDILNKSCPGSELNLKALTLALHGRLLNSGAAAGDGQLDQVELQVCG
jgi:CheY-like chemotaxis protein